MKVVIVIDRTMPPGLVANAAAVLAFSVSPHVPGGIGEDAVDADGAVHTGITRIPIPILGAEPSLLPDLIRQAGSTSGVGYIDFCDIAQQSTDYARYRQSLGRTSSDSIRYVGICIYGEPGNVRRITGSLPLLR
jgi:hypothetical protein